MADQKVLQMGILLVIQMASLMAAQKVLQMGMS